MYCMHLYYTYIHIYILYIYFTNTIWRFPEIGVPPKHPFLDRIFPYKPSILGYPMTMETPSSTYTSPRLGPGSSSWHHFAGRMPQKKNQRIFHGGKGVFNGMFIGFLWDFYGIFMGFYGI